MDDSSRLDLYVLDTLANDYEDLESILRMLNSDTVLGWHSEWGRLFRRDEIVASLSRLVKAGRAVVAAGTGGSEFEPLSPSQLPPASYDDVYFGMTEKGRMVHSTWASES